MSSSPHIGSKILRFRCIDSTNAYLKRESQALPHGAVVVADHQTAGRGRLGRNWFDLPGKSLMFSFLLSENDCVKKCTDTIWPAVAVLAALEKLGVQAQVKWPNDILLNGRKTGGILAEAVRKKEQSILVFGIGINCYQSSDELPHQLAGSIMAQTGKRIDRDVLFSELLQSLNAAAEEVLAHGNAKMHKRWLKNCYHFNSPVAVETDTGRIEGVFIGLDEQGFAQVKTSGKVHRIVSCKKLLIKDMSCC